MKSQFISLLISTLILYSCNEDSSLRLASNTIIIGHKGSGPIDAYGNGLYYENSLPSIKNALHYLDGTELDIQMSLDTTLWVFHDDKIKYLKDTIAISSLHDKQIEQTNSEHFSNNLIKLNNLMQNIQLNYCNKTICFDLKVLQNKNTIEQFKGKNNLAKIVAKQINKLKINRKKITVILEIYGKKQLDVIKKRCHLKSFLVYDQSPNAKYYKNINASFSINDTFHQHFLNSKIQKSVWVANTCKDFENATRYRPNFIQTDHISLGRFFKKSKKQKLNKKILFEHKHIKSKTEFIDLFSYYTINKSNSIIEIEIEAEMKDTLNLVFAANNNKSKLIYWTNHKVFNGEKNIKQYIDINYFRRNKAHKVNVYLWNKDKNLLVIPKIRVFNNSYES